MARPGSGRMVQRRRTHPLTGRTITLGIAGAAGVASVLICIILGLGQIQPCNPLRQATLPEAIQATLYVSTCNQAATAADTYYQALIARDWERAFAAVAPFDQFSDVPPTTPPDQLEAAWVARVAAQHHSGTSIAAIESVEIVIDDGALKARAQLTVIHNGTSRSVVQQVSFVERARWKIQTVRSNAPELAAFDAALSGFIR